MVPKLGRREGLGQSFYHAWQYYCHDKDAQTDERVALTHTLNLDVTDPLEAVKAMFKTFQDAEALKRRAGISPRGRKGQRPVLHWSLSWAPDERPTHAQMIAEARKSIEAAGYAEHQALLVIHSDEPQPHIHIIVSRVHPRTGVMVKPSFIKLKLSRRAEAYERERGRIRCRRRVVNNRRRAAGEYVKYRPPAIAQAWERARNGRGFAAALSRNGYVLARGDRRGFVVVDLAGEVHNPAREIEGVRTADIRAKLADLDPASLPNVGEARARAAQWRQQQERIKARKRARLKAKGLHRDRRRQLVRKPRIRPRPAPLAEETQAQGGVALPALPRDPPAATVRTVHVPARLRKHFASPAIDPRDLRERGPPAALLSPSPPANDQPVSPRAAWPLSRPPSPAPF